MTDEPANHWAPAIAADRKGNVYVAWDSYENGNYDVFMRRFHDGEPEPVVPVARSRPSRPGRAWPSMRQDRVWIAYEQGGPNWGKDFGRVVPKSAAIRRTAKAKLRRGRIGPARRPATAWAFRFIRSRAVVVKCYADGRLQQPAADPAAAWNELPRPKSFARLAVADDGRLWLLFRHHPLPGGAARDLGRICHVLRRQGLEQAADAGQFRQHSRQSAGRGPLRRRRRAGRLQQRLAAARREQRGTAAAACR